MSIAERIIAASLADFARRHPGELAGGPVEATPAGWFDATRAAQIGAVHREMIETAYHNDTERFGHLDYWIADAAGDCEDKALWCHRKLAEAGWPKAAMRLWLCRARQGGRWRGHAVLVLRLTLFDGAVADVAMDCLRGTPALKEDLGHRNWRMVEPPRPEASAP